MAVYIAIICILLLLIAGTVFYNTLIRSRNKMLEAWSIIDVYLKNRHELVPALVNIAKGYSIHETETLINLSSYRSEAIAAKETSSQIASEEKLDNAIHNVILMYERYPELKADNGFLKLQYQLTDIEDNLEKVRRYYNGSVREYNTLLKSFPTNLIANISGFKKGIFYKSQSAHE